MTREVLVEELKKSILDDIDRAVNYLINLKKEIEEKFEAYKELPKGFASITEKQKQLIIKLCREAGINPPEDLEYWSKEEASEYIDQLMNELPPSKNQLKYYQDLMDEAVNLGLDVNPVTKLTRKAVSEKIKELKLLLKGR